jgi:hypothetical protein
MVMRWRISEERSRTPKSIINAVGACATIDAPGVVTVSNFAEGA